MFRSRYKSSGEIQEYYKHWIILQAQVGSLSGTFVQTLNLQVSVGGSAVRRLTSIIEWYAVIAHWKTNRVHIQQVILNLPRIC